MTTARRLGLLGIALLSLTAATCDGYLGVEGRVYEQLPAAPGGNGGVVFVDSFEQVLPPSLMAVAGCDVVVEPWTPAERSKRSAPELWTERTKTDQSGYFKTGTTAKPGKYDSTISVTCPGHPPLQRVFRHDRLRHHAVVVLGSPPQD